MATSPCSRNLAKQASALTSSTAGMEMLFLALGSVLALAISVAHWHTMSPDALSYLEVGEAWWRGDFRNAINGYWSPLYPILVAAFAKLAAGSVYEGMFAHLSNVLCFVAAFFSFRLFLREVENKIDAGEETVQFNFRLASYAVFLWVCFCLIELTAPLPDLLLLVWTLLAAANLLRLETDGGRAAAGLGLFLALGYLTKPVMFPLGLLFLVVCAFSIRPLRRAAALTAAAAIVFLSVSALYLTPLSIQKQRFTFSDSGALAYAWEVNRISPYIHWQGQPPASGTPKHGTRQILDFPPAYEFDRNRPGTYPLWYDASYWNDGLRPRFILKNQISRLRQSANYYWTLLFNEPVSAVFLFSVLIAGASIGWARLWWSTRPFFPLVLIAIATLAIYAPVFVVARYLAAAALFLAIPLLAAYCRANGFNSPEGSLWARAFAIFTGFIVVSTCAYSVASGLFGNRPTSYRVHSSVLSELRKLDVKPGDKVAVIGRGLDPYFARLGQLKIIAEAPVLDGHPTWLAISENLDRIVAAFARQTEAAVVVSNVAPLDSRGAVAWQPVNGTPYWIHRITR